MKTFEARHLQRHGFHGPCDPWSLEPTGDCRASWRPRSLEKHVSAAGGAETIREDKERLLAQVRAHRLADIRKRQGLTQREVAAAMGVSIGRVSQIEAGDISGIDVLDRYVTAIGGLLEIVATFGDEQFKVG
jgi:DNA-binding XRE family transcriptional regulator